MSLEIKTRKKSQQLPPFWMNLVEAIDFAKVEFGTLSNCILDRVGESKIEIQTSQPLSSTKVSNLLFSIFMSTWAQDEEKVSKLPDEKIQRNNPIMEIL